MWDKDSLFTDGPYTNLSLKSDFLLSSDTAYKAQDCSVLVYMVKLTGRITRPNPKS